MLHCDCKCHPVFDSLSLAPSYESKLIITLEPSNCDSPIRPDLICKMCEGCVWNPKRCANCGKYFCQPCIDKYT